VIIVNLTSVRAFVFSLVGVGLGWGGPAAGQDAPAFPPATPESQGLPAAAVRAVADEVAAYVKNGASVGAELLIVKNRKTVLHEAYGDRDREDKRPMERNTIFNIRSMTKPLTGAAVQILVDEGKLRLDDPVAKYLPGFDNDKSRAITVKQLLEHRSGLPLTVITTAINQYPDLQAQARAAGEKGPQYKPGERFWYSDAGSDTAAAVVEKVSGQTIDRFVTDWLLKPLGMADSFYPSKSDDPRKARLASLYIGSPGNWNRFWKPGGNPMYPFAWGSQTLYSTPADYARFVAMWVDGGKAGGRQILSKDAMKRVLTPVSPMLMLGADAPYPTGFDGLKPYYGEMAEVYSAGDSPATAKPVVIGHSGSDGTAAWAFPADDLIICYFTQSRGSPTVIRLETVIDRELLQRGKPQAKVPDEMKPYLGTFYANFAHYKNAPFKVVFHNGRLAVDIPDQLIFELKEPDKDGRRAFAISDKITVAFKKDPAGKIVSMNLNQAGQSFDMPTTPVKTEPVKKEAVEKYLGKYEREEDKVVVEVRFKDGTLSIHVPTTKSDAELKLRADKKSWAIRTNPGLTVTFQEDKAGKVPTFTVESADGKKRVRKRID
jgi:CubicO group peptidase (beta-lactamase class C family)